MKRGKDNSNWRGGRTITTFGYIYLWQEKHPYANKDSCVAEHRLVVEKTIGRYLKPTECVHHINDIADNTNKNLVACENNAYHHFLHQRKRAYDATGNVHANFCRFCKMYDSDNNLTVIKNRRAAYHKKCNSKRTMEYKNHETKNKTDKIRH